VNIDLPYLRVKGESRGIAFIKFISLEAAMDYMERYYPSIQIGDTKVKIAYSLGRGEEDNGWTCDKVGNKLTSSLFFFKGYFYLDKN